jgi:hypothetical protein
VSKSDRCPKIYIEWRLTTMNLVDCRLQCLLL